MPENEMHGTRSRDSVGEILRTDKNYPVLLNKLKDAPDPLYFKGCYKEDIFRNTLAVVGSRAVTMYGEWIVDNIVREVARYGVTIVSGFMYGVDALSHRAALDAGGITVAVMAGGVHNIFPKYQEQLYYDIVDEGLVVSEYLEGAEGKWMFARRNRIVAGLSYAVLVVEATESSGSLITADYAKQYNRCILTVPANLNSVNSVGTTQLIREGAKLVTCADDVLQLYFSDPSNYRRDISTAVNKRLLSSEACCYNDYAQEGEGGVYENLPQAIIKNLSLEPLSSDELAYKLNLNVKDVLKVVTGLSLEGVVREKEGKYYAN